MMVSEAQYPGVLLVLGVAFYFLPTVLAVATKRRKRDMIMLVNFIAGWTGIGWLGCLFWAAASESDPKKSGFNCDVCGNPIVVELGVTKTFCPKCGEKYEISVRE